MSSPAPRSPSSARESAPPVPPRLLTIAGSDSGGGAGIQADLKTFAAHGAYGMSALTAVTAQNTRAVTAVHELPVEVVEAQIDAVFEDLGVDGVKVGMLASAPLVEAVAGRLEHWLERREAASALPIVLDPVMVAKTGDALLAEDAVDALARRLLPLATVVTPNLPEAERLLGRPIDDDAADPETTDREAAARELGERIKGGVAVLLKGGHGGGERVVDVLWDPAAGRVHRFEHRRVETRATHGTGCTLSSAVAARLAAGDPLARAVEGAIAYLQRALATAYPLGAGHGPVNHLHPFRADRPAGATPADAPSPSSPPSPSPTSSSSLSSTPDPEDEP